MIEQTLLDWLLQPENPSARYLALRHLWTGQRMTLR
jgi:hypothetical protein